MQDFIHPRATSRDFYNRFDYVAESGADFLKSYMSNSASLEDLQCTAVRLGNEAFPLPQGFGGPDKSGHIGNGLDAIGKDRDFIKYIGLVVLPWVIQKVLVALVAEDEATRIQFKKAMP